MPENEDARLAALYELRILDTAAEDSYDDIVRLAAFICDAPAAAVSFVDIDRQWFKSSLGLSVTETPRDVAFFTHAILGSDLLVVPDATLDTRFADNPLVTGEPHIRFYAGAPLVTEDGYVLGSLCVIDHAPKRLTVKQESMLRALARQVSNNLELARRTAVQGRLIAEREQAVAAHRQSEERFEAAFRNAAVGVSIVDALGRFLFVNKAFCTITGYSEEELLARDFAAITHPDDLSVNVALAEQVWTGQIPSFVLEKRYVRKDGSLVWVQISVSHTREGRDHGEHSVSLTEDITSRKEAERAQAEAWRRTADLLAVLEINQKQMSLILGNVKDIVFLLEVVGEESYRFLFANPPFMDVTGLREEEIIGRPIQEIIPPPSWDLVLGKYAEAIRERRAVEWQETSVYPCGERIGDVRGIPIFDSQERCTHLLGTVHDITDRKRAEDERAHYLREVQERADRDPLTSLLNHRAFHHRLDTEASCAQRDNTVLAVIMLDLDNFKFFNDVYGHAAGDEVLRLVANKLRTVCRSSDTLARFGGDEFALLLPCVGRSTTEEIESRLSSALHELSYCAGERGGVIPISISLGAALFPAAGGSDYHVALQRADDRLRWAKTGGDTEQMARRIRTDAGARVQGFSMLDALVTAVDNKDRYTRRHSEDVMEYSLAIARELGLSETEQSTVAVAALLHDVGKIGVPDHILRKPGKLTPEEFEAVKQHPMMGAVMVHAVPGLEETLDAVRHHHERWDGSGYPFGLSGEETPLIARLMAVADAFSAMTTDRPYRKGMSSEQAMSILEGGAGTQWDQTCVHAFRRAQETLGES
ncbi:hypothetical protein CCAX7_28270 [Capsulimonas corticalis]|uniref:Uncharacterized protein n=1 Tax=Capsulimonas corticalis TaxID=2219043 RepID=A0A402CTB4_9BACT|nr:PAS domain S-box protein [Capsulimonas corticalis]BDI30776.1 hypothetical protein CCAX7_28270 [Capsulimonas corticalis]